MSNVEKRKKVTELVKEEKISLKIALKAMHLNKATYYHKPKEEADGRRRPLDDELISKLKSVSGYELVYGYRRMNNYFNREYNHKKVYRHMKALKMLQPRKLKKHAKKRLEISCPIESNIRWEGDLTYVYDGQKMNYLFVVVDTFDKEPIGDYYGLRCRADEAIISLEKAIKNRFGNLQMTSYQRVTLRLDQGSQYISKKFKKRANELGVKLEYCGLNCPNDKPYVESFFSRYKCEEVYRNEYCSYTNALLGWIQYKDWYCNQRIHTGLNNMTIPQFKQQKGSLLYRFI